MAPPPGLPTKAGPSCPSCPYTFSSLPLGAATAEPTVQVSGVAAHLPSPYPLLQRGKSRLGRTHRDPHSNNEKNWMICKIITFIRPTGELRSRGSQGSHTAQDAKVLRGEQGTPALRARALPHSRRAGSSCRCRGSWGLWGGQSDHLDPGSLRHKVGGAGGTLTASLFPWVPTTLTKKGGERMKKDPQ